VENDIYMFSFILDHFGFGIKKVWLIQIARTAARKCRNWFL